MKKLSESKAVVRSEAIGCHDFPQLNIRASEQLNGCLSTANCLHLKKNSRIVLKSRFDCSCESKRRWRWLSKQWMSWVWDVFLIMFKQKPSPTNSSPQKTLGQNITVLWRRSKIFTYAIDHPLISVPSSPPLSSSGSSPCFWVHFHLKDRKLNIALYPTDVH